MKDKFIIIIISLGNYVMKFYIKIGLATHERVIIRNCTYYWLITPVSIYWS
jgi:hypothetical protein